MEDVPARARVAGAVVRGVPRRLTRTAPGAAVVAVLAWRLGGSPFLAALHAVSCATLVAAVAIGAATTVLSAWRWALVAGGLGMPLPLRDAVGAYYRALFLNGVLPGGAVGDVHRAVRHGRDAGDVRLAATAVVLERCAGQAVLVTVALATALATLLGPLVRPPALPAGDGRQTLAVPATIAAVAAVALVAALVAVLTLAVAARVARRRGARWVGAVGAWAVDVRRALSAGRRAPVLAASVAVVAGHIATFIVAAHAAGASLPLARLLPLSLVSLLAMSVPLNIGGWGPREGVTAWAFAAAGLSARQGLTIAVVYGLFALVASLPGAAVLARTWIAGAAPDSPGGDLAGPRLTGRLGSG